MLRTCVLGCAVAGLVGLTVGCVKNGSGPSKPAVGAKDEFLATYKVKLDEADAKLAELKGKAAKSAGDEKARMDARLTDAAARREAFVRKLDEAKAAAADKWEGLKAGVATTYDEFKKSVE